MAGEIKRKMRETYQTRIPTFSGQVTSVGIGADGRSLGYIMCSIGGSTLKVLCGPMDNYQPGDWVTVEQRGGAASAGYYAMGFISGVRSNSQILEVPDDTTIGGVSYHRGDLLLGDPTSKFWFYDASQAAWLMQDAATMRGAIGNLDGLYDYVAATYGTAFGTEAGPHITIDETNGIRQFAGSTQVSWFKADGSGWLGGSDKLSWDTAGNMTLAGSLLTGAGTIFMNEDGFWLGDPDTGASLTLNEVKDVYGAGTGSFGLRIYDQEGVAHISLLSRASNTPYFRLGAPDADTWLQWDENGLELKGTIRATAGEITGALYVGDGDPRILIDGTNKLIESTNFVTGYSGFRLNGVTGSAEFEDITARGAIKTAVFQKSLVTAFAGSQVVSKSASTVAEAVTLSATTFPLVVKAQDGAPFVDGDLVYIKTETIATYAIVNTGTASGDNWAYTAAYHSGSDTGTVPVGTAVVDYGGNGAGRVWLSADGSNTPHLSISTHDMAAPPAWTERVRLGNLDGISGTSGYGLWTDNGWFTGTVTASVIRSAASGARIEMNTSKIFGTNGLDEQWYASAADGKLYAGQGSVVLDYDGVKIYSNSSDANKLSFLTGSSQVGHIAGYNGPRYTGDPGLAAQLNLWSHIVGAADSSEINLRATGGGIEGGRWATLQVISRGIDPSLIVLNADAVGITGDLAVYGGVQTKRFDAYGTLQTYNGGMFIPVTTPITSGSWTGDTYSTTGATPLNIVSTFGLPVDVKAILVTISVRDSGGAGNYYLALGPSNTYYYSAICLSTSASWHNHVGPVIIPCLNGDVYYAIQASGTGTLNVYLRIWGYWL